MILRCATTNPGKLREFNMAAAHFGFGDIHIEALPELNDLPVPIEDGDSFEANAIKKALHYSAFTMDPVFADDSGLEVDALDNAPGVYSARYASSPEGGIDADLANNQLLIKNLQGVENRTARFVCVIALAREGCVLETFRGEVQGVIIDEARGSGGFGYDPHFFYPPFGATFGETLREAKMDVSHRGKALRAMLQYLQGAR